MAETLVIVESPSKAKTIEKYLGSKYRVIASNGHVRDLPKSQLGVDVEHDFEPKYITLRGRGEVIEKIRKEAKHAKHIVLATDPDREGEAISWHLAKMLKLDENEPCRVVFNEITKTVIQKAVKNPRCIDRNLVDAQQARRAGLRPAAQRRVRSGFPLCARRSRDRLRKSTSHFLLPSVLHRHRWGTPAIQSVRKVPCCSLSCFIWILRPV